MLEQLADAQALGYRAPAFSITPQTHWAIRHIQKLRPAIVYIHPYEIDFQNNFPDPPPSAEVALIKTACRFHRLQMRNRSSVSRKSARLLTGFNFTTLWQLIQNQFPTT